MVPRVGCGQAEQQADQRRLAGAVGAEEAERDTGRDEQVDAVERQARAEGLAETAGLDGHGAGVGGSGEGHGRDGARRAARAHGALGGTRSGAAG